MQNLNNKSLSSNPKIVKKQQKKIYKQGSIWFKNLLEKKKKNHSLSIKTDKIFFNKKIAEIKENSQGNSENIKFFITKEYEIRPRISTEISIQNQKYIKKLINFIRQYKWA